MNETPKISTSEVVEMVKKLMDQDKRFHGDIVIKNVAHGVASHVEVYQTLKRASQIIFVA